MQGHEGRHVRMTTYSITKDYPARTCACEASAVVWVMSEPSYALCGRARIQKTRTNASTQRIDGEEVPTLTVAFEFVWKEVAYRKTQRLILN